MIVRTKSWTPHGQSNPHLFSFGLPPPSLLMSRGAVPLCRKHWSWAPEWNSLEPSDDARGYCSWLHNMIRHDKKGCVEKPKNKDDPSSRSDELSSWTPALFYATKGGNPAGTGKHLRMSRKENQPLRGGKNTLRKATKEIRGRTGRNDAASLNFYGFCTVQQSKWIFESIWTPYHFLTILFLAEVHEQSRCFACDWTAVTQIDINTQAIAHLSRLA